MPRYNKQDIDRKSNKPNPSTTEGLQPDLILNRAMQTRRDDDVIRTKKQTLYDIDYAIKWYIDNEIQPQIKDNDTLISVPVIFSNGEKWDSVRRLGYLRDEKGMLQSPLIMLKRNSTVERDNLRTLDVNRIPSSNYLTHKQKYNARNRYEDELFPIPTNQPQSSDKIYVIDIPKYVTVEYDMMIWCDFTAQLNDVIDQVIPYGRYAWGNDGNRFATSIGNISFETVNTVGEDRLVRATVPLTVQGVLLAEQESRVSTLKKMYSVKKVTFDYVVTDELLFTSTIVPQQIIQMGGGTIVTSGGNQVQITNNIFTYLVTMSDKQATYVNSTTVSISAYAAVNPVTLTTATKNEFDVYINGQYIDKVCYTWTPSDTTNQSIVFDTTTLGYTISSDDVVIVNGRWA
jgi:glutaredoxin